MEVRVVKTCQGLERIRFADGALLPPDVGMVELCEARKLQAETELLRELDEVSRYLWTAQAWHAWSAASPRKASQNWQPRFHQAS